jgi:uncharacterized protein
MTDQREMIQAQKAHCEERVRGLRAYVKELTEMAARLGTDEALIHDDLTKAKFDIEFYEGLMASACEADGEGGRQPAFHVYEDAKGEWRWNLKAANGRIIADSGEGYRDRADCLHGVALVKRSSDAPVKEGR